MKIQSRTKLTPDDLLPFKPGRTGIGSPSSSAAFQLNPPDLSPLKPGLFSKSAADAQLNPPDLSAFHPGHPGKAELKPLQLGEQPTGLGATSAASKSQHDQLTEKAQKWVSQTFFGTMLKQMSDSPFKSDLFNGGRGGEAFSSLYHQQLADRMARGAGTKLVQSIVKGIESKQAKAKEEGSGFRVQGSEKKSESRPLNTQDPRTKAYMRSRPSPAKQSTFSLAA
jgi:Rod binding domain-containing protein